MCLLLSGDHWDLILVTGVASGPWDLVLVTGVEPVTLGTCPGYRGGK